jgi:DNA-binding CsgD family transcriptional regulator
MANQENNNAYINVNPEMKISYVSAEDVKKYQAQGYRHMMVKFPSEEDMPEMTGQERRVLRLFMAGKSTQKIAEIIRIDDRSVSRLLSRIRKKFGCLSNTELMSRVEYLGISMVLP